jgi:uncharacterized protein
MDQRTIESTIKAYVALLPKRFSLSKVYLFGSYARNTFREESDIDVAFVMKNIGDVFQTQLDLMKLRRTVDLRLEPHPIDEKDFNEANPLANEILKYGKEIVL